LEISETLDGIHDAEQGRGTAGMEMNVVNHALRHRTSPPEHHSQSPAHQHQSNNHEQSLKMIGDVGIRMISLEVDIFATKYHNDLRVVHVLH